MPSDATEGPAPARWRLDIRYDGTDFAGWAAQAGLRTVQGELELWLARVLRLADPVRLVCAGRTDAGVHARGQVAHVDLPADCIVDDRLVPRLRRALPGDIAVTAITRAPEAFDARFAAIWRHYCYRVADAATIRDPLLRTSTLDLDRELDLDKINAAAADLVGLRDFAAFCRARSDATAIRRLMELRVDRGSEALVEFTVRADAFCHSMVRSLVGALLEIGTSRRDRAWLVDVAAARCRDGRVPVLPARGLTLEEVGYPPDGQLADRVRAARTRRELPDV